MSINKHLDMGEAIYRHYQRFLGSPVASFAFEQPGASHGIQVLEFAKVFPRCRSYATFGYGRLSWESAGVFQEVFAAVDGDHAGIPEILAGMLSSAIDLKIPIEQGTSIRGADQFAKSFAEHTGKTALYFVSPFLLPREFETIPGGELPARMLMAVPISQAEHDLVRRAGAVELERLFGIHDIDPFQVLRPSVI